MRLEAGVVGVVSLVVVVVVGGSPAAPPACIVASSGNRKEPKDLGKSIPGFSIRVMYSCYFFRLVWFDSVWFFFRGGVATGDSDALVLYQRRETGKRLAQQSETTIC